MLLGAYLGLFFGLLCGDGVLVVTVLGRGCCCAGWVNVLMGFVCRPRLASRWNSGSGFTFEHNVGIDAPSLRDGKSCRTHNQHYV